MKKILVHILNTNIISVDDLLSSIYLNDFDKSIFDKYKCVEVKKERIGSTILKNKYIKDYYVDDKGKPLSEHICFNVSHSYGYVIIAIDENPIGVDIEKIREVKDDLKQYISSLEEYKNIIDDKSFFKIWTNKESLSKCVGEGLNKNIKEIPALPFDGKREYLNKTFITNQIEYNNYIISITLESNQYDYIDIEIIEESI